MKEFFLKEEDVPDIVGKGRVLLAWETFIAVSEGPVKSSRRQCSPMIDRRFQTERRKSYGNRICVRQ